MAIQTVGRPAAPRLHPRDAGCPLPVYRADDTVDPSCREVGDVFVGDTGWTVDCGSKPVMRAIQDEACRFGADAAQIVAHHEPSFWGSTCHQMRARFLICNGERQAESAAAGGDMPSEDAWRTQPHARP